MPSPSLYHFHAHPTVLALALVVTACGGTGGGETGTATTDPTSSAAATAPTSSDSSGTTASSEPTGVGPGDTSSGSSDAHGSTTTSSTNITTPSGETGDPSTGSDAPGVCQEVCRSDSDCLVGGVDQDLVCTDSRCVPDYKPGACTSDLFCQIGLVGSFKYCESSESCGSGWCIDVENGPTGMCAYTPDARNQCPYPKIEEIVELPTVEGESRLVCLTKYSYCDIALGADYQGVHYCGLLPAPCDTDNECKNDPTTPVCGDTGTCICTEDAQCSTPGSPSCVAGRCSCTSDADCAVLGDADVCVDGACGCSSAAVCTAHHDGAQPVCEPR